MAQRCKVLSGCFRKKLGQGSKQAGAQHEEKQCGEAKSKNSALCPWRCCSWSVLQTSVQATQKCDLHFLSRLQRQTCTHTQKKSNLISNNTHKQLKVGFHLQHCWSINQNVHCFMKSTRRAENKAGKGNTNCVWLETGNQIQLKGLKGCRDYQQERRQS